MSRATQQNPTTPVPALYVALELSKDNWKLALTTSRVRRPRMRDVAARNQAAFLAEIESAKRHFGLPEEAPVFSCYEAGRDGFWIHRFLAANGIENVVDDPASIEVSRRKRKLKTDRVDSARLARESCPERPGQGSGDLDLLLAGGRVGDLLERSGGALGAELAEGPNRAQAYGEGLTDVGGDAVERQQGLVSAGSRDTRQRPSPDEIAWIAHDHVL